MIDIGGTVKIESQDKTVAPDVELSTTDNDGKHEVATLDYETWRRDELSKTVTIRSYDASGTAVSIRLSQSLAEELIFGEIIHDPR